MQFSKGKMRGRYIIEDASKLHKCVFSKGKPWLHFIMSLKSVLLHMTIQATIM